MSSFGLLTVPSRLRRKSSSTSTSISIDSYIYGFGGAAPSSSPPSSPTLLTPLHLARPYGHTTWQTSDYSDDLDEANYSQPEVDDDPWSRPTRSEHSVSYLRHLPSLVTKFATPTLWGDALPYSPLPFTSASYLYPQGESAIADDCEEYDLESMNIHIHETYFATSAERGRWLSSPIASRVRSHVAPPNCSYSSPVKTLANASREHTNSCAISEDQDEDMHCSSSLPPSSPLSSPLSDHSFLGDSNADNAIVNPCPNPDDPITFFATPELSIPSTACTSPVEPARPSTPRKSTIASPLPSPHTPFHSSSSAISCHSNSRRSRSPNPVDEHVHAPEAGFESDGALSPLSQFELDLPEPEPLKVPLSGVENKLCTGQHIANPGVNANTIQSHSGSLSVQFSSMNDESLEVSLETVGGVKSERNTKRRRETPTDKPRTRKTKERTVILSRSPASDGKKKSGVENDTSNDSEPPNKKSKLSRCKGDCGGKSRRRRSGTSKAERRRRSPSYPTIERCDSESVRASKHKTPETIVPLQQPASGDPAVMEFHASLTGMVIEAFALSRATSMDSSSLYLVLTQTHPYIAAERSKQTLLMDIVDVLEAGRVRCGMFEKVDCSGERSRHRPLESRWFYVPERDEDGERASLISAIMPRQKRNETKKYKQYYYRPLEKMSRWDPEDAP